MNAELQAMGPYVPDVVQCFSKVIVISMSRFSSLSGLLDSWRSEDHKRMSLFFAIIW